MRPIVRFGLGIIIISLLTAVAVAVYFLLNDRSISLTMLVLPSAGFVFGIAVIISGIGSYLGIQDEIDNLEHLVGDDIEDLMAGRITYTHIKLVTTVVAIIAEVYFLFTYQKWTATWWGGIPVIIIAVVCIGMILYGGVTMRWFQNRERRTYWWVFALFFIGWMVSAYVGINRTEPIEFGALPPVEREDYSYNWGTTRASNSSFFSDSSGSFSSVDFAAPSCDGDACGAVVLFILIVMIVLICISGSAFIPHFWVVATCMLLTAMAIVALRELLVVDSSWKSEKTKVDENDVAEMFKKESD